MSAKKFLFLLSIISTQVFSTTIKNPFYELKKSGIYNVDKIELGSTETLVYLHISFYPHWWVSFSKPECIIDSQTGKKYEATDLRGAKFDEKVWMPDSGDSTIVIVFPPLDKNVKKIDYNTEIFGISLSGKSRYLPIEKNVPDEITNWLALQLKNTKKSVEENNFGLLVQPDTARIVGYLNGYDKRLGFTSGIINLSNAITTEKQTVLLKIDENGKFEAKLPISYPIYSGVTIANQFVPFYIEPGSIVSIDLNWSEFQKASRFPIKRYVFKDIRYGGTLATINAELNSVNLNDPNYNKTEQSVVKMTPDTFKKEQLKDMKTNLELVEKARMDHSLNTKTVDILKNKISMQMGNMMFSYVKIRKFEALKDSVNANLKQVLPADFYDFTSLIPLNDKSILANDEFSTFINRFEFSEPFMSISKKANFKPKKDFYEYLLDRKNTLSASDYELIMFLNKVKNNKDSVWAIEKRSTEIKRFFENNKQYLEDYTQNYFVVKFSENQLENSLLDWRAKDSVLLNKFGLSPNFVSEIMKVRTLKSSINNFKSGNIANYWTNLKKGISDTMLVNIGNEYLKEKLNSTAPISYSLPNSTGTNILKKIIDSFKGKQLFIDFWATKNNLCTSSIKAMKSKRDVYMGNRDFDFIFITDERSSPQEDYDKFVKEQELTNTFRLTVDDFNYIRQLFSISGLPRYVIIDAKGFVKNDNFNMNLFEVELNMLSK